MRRNETLSHLGSRRARPGRVRRQSNTRVRKNMKQATLRMSTANKDMIPSGPEKHEPDHAEDQDGESGGNREQGKH